MPLVEGTRNLPVWSEYALPVISRTLGKTNLVRTLGFVDGSMVGVTDGLVVGAGVGICETGWCGCSVTLSLLLIVGDSSSSSSSMIAGGCLVGMSVALLMLGDGSLTYFCLVGNALM